MVLRPPYQFDAATPGQTIAFSQFFGQHGYLPNMVDLAHNINMHATFVAAGPGIRHQSPVTGVRAIDLAPTLAFLMNIPGPQNARGRILYELTAEPGPLQGDDDPRHQRLPRPARPARGGGRQLGGTGALNPTFAIGGSAFLKPWFDTLPRRGAEWLASPSPVATRSAAPRRRISTFFGDKPTPRS